MNAHAINQTFDLLSLVENDTHLKRSGAGWWAAPCPFCGGRDRFVVKQTTNGWRWLCRQCGDGKYHTSLDYVMRRDKLSFKDALAALGGKVQQRTAKTAKAKSPPLLPADTWQAAAWSEVTAAADALLLKPEGQPGREYLLQRGLHQGTWEAWTLGFACVHGRTAITLPWFANDYDLHAVKYRFIDDNNPRYLARKGSQPVIYGLAWTFGFSSTLLICEGEINALSIWQMQPSDVDVVSVGSESGGRPELLKALAARYGRVVLWFDKPDQVRKAQAAIGKPAILLQSPLMNGHKMDANAILRAGLLYEFLERALNTRCAGWQPGNSLNKDNLQEQPWPIAPTITRLSTLPAAGTSTAARFGMTLKTTLSARTAARTWTGAINTIPMSTRKTKNERA